MRLRVAPHLRELITHRSEVDHGRHAGEVLKQDARRAKGDLGTRGRGWVPVGHRLDVLMSDCRAVLISEQVLEQNADGIREGIHALETRARQRIQAVNHS